jgi:uncharacterized membrane protein YcjF (UPF0283 family)
MIQEGYKRHVRDFAGPVSLVLFPPAIMVLLTSLNVVSWSMTIQFLKLNWGSAASVWGLIVGFYVLIVAKGVRRAAQDATNKEVLRVLLQNLEEARGNIRDLGFFARDNKWDIVYVKAMDALLNCTSAISNWDDEPTGRKMKNKLNTATTITRTIAELVGNSTARPIENSAREQILRSHLNVSEILGTVIIHVHKMRRKVNEQ